MPQAPKRSLLLASQVEFENGDTRIALAHTLTAAAQQAVNSSFGPVASLTRLEIEVL